MSNSNGSHRGDRGLHAPSGPVLGGVEPVGGVRFTPVRVVLQTLGLLIGLGLLGWALSLALDEGNRASIEALRRAPADRVALLLGLSVAGLVLNGAMFWAVLRPLRRLALLDVMLVNAMATALSVLPFKLGLLTRVLVHHRRDGVRFKDLLAWIAAMGALALAVLLPLGLASAWRGRVDGLWWLVALGGAVVCSGAGVALGRISARAPVLRRLSLGADAIVRDWRPVLAHLALRLADVGLLAARFAVASSIVGYAMGPDRAVLFATTYFLLSVLAPAGTLGFREMGVAALGWAGEDDERALALVALVVSAAELLSAFVVALGGWARIRPDRLLLRRARTPE
ncbi:MAG TPA: hypothetical protein DEB06_01980 [Phycisphaerales bacterium]|nr:hypothetical protein [Phycisphaerales bacterium]